MKKLAIIIALLFGMNILASAQGGLFKRGAEPEGQIYGPRNGMPLLPTIHNQGENQDADAAPLGGGVLVLVGLGAGYAIIRRKKRE